MKKILLAILMLGIGVAGFAQEVNRYFNEFGEEINRKRFEKSVANGFFNLQKEDGRETHHFLLDRVQRGQLNNSFLQTFHATMGQVNERLVMDELIAIRYYPGLDNCNRNFIGDEERYLLVNEPGEQLLERTYTNPVLHFFKSAEGLEPYIEKYAWKKDPNGLLEKLFFPHHYPCESFVIVHPEGFYYAFLGEYSITSMADAKYEFDAIISDMDIVEETESTKAKKERAKRRKKN